MQRVRTTTHLMISTDSVSTRSPATRVGFVPLGFSFRYQGSRDWPLKRSIFLSRYCIRKHLTFRNLDHTALIIQSRKASKTKPIHQHLLWEYTIHNKHSKLWDHLQALLLQSQPGFSRVECKRVVVEDWSSISQVWSVRTRTCGTKRNSCQPLL